MRGETGYTRVQVVGGVGVLTIDRPPANALDLALVRELSAVAAATSARPEVGALVVTGAGPRFVAGADIAMMHGLPPERFPAFISGVQRAMEDIEALPLPTVAAVNGHAMGGGLELALACDVRFVAEGARLGLPEVLLGLLPGAGGTVRLGEIVGRGRALELLYTGRSIGAQEAVEIGLANRVAAVDRLLDEAIGFAAALAAGPRAALREIKACVLASLDGGRHAGFRAEAAGIGRLFGTSDAAEGMAAFLGKRAPRFGADPAGADPAAQ